MDQNAALLDAIAISSLPEPAMIARLASRHIYKLFTMTEAKAAIRAILPKRGDLERLASLLLAESRRQTPIHASRTATKLAMARQHLSIGQRLNTPTMRHRAHVDSAQREFGEYVRGVFADDALVMLDLISMDARLYGVRWLDGGVRPTISAVIEVEIRGSTGVNKANFLLYKIPGTSETKAVEVGAATLRFAWSEQVPLAVLELRSTGHSVTTNFENQTFEVTGPAGSHVFSWECASDSAPV